MSFKVLSRFTDIDGKVLFHDDSEDHEGVIEETVYDEDIWDDMKAGKQFYFHIDVGCYDTQDRSSNFAILQYIMAQPEGKSLKEIIGEDISVVTHRGALLHILQKQMGIMFNDPVEISCERFSGFTFVTLITSYDSDPTDHYRSVRVKRFNGPDVPGCVGNVPATNFVFPAIGEMHSVIKMNCAKGKHVLYTSQFSRYSPDGKTVDMRAIDAVNWGTRSVFAKKRVSTKSALQAKLAGLDNYIFMHFNNNKRTLQAFFGKPSDFNSLIDSYPRSATTLNIENLFAHVERFLDRHGRCLAKLEQKRDGWQFVPRHVDVNYKSFLSQAFRDRFATKKPNGLEVKDVNDNVDQKQ